MHDDGTQSDQSALEQTKSGLNRRQLMKAGAWAAPVVVLAAAVPAAAASVGAPQTNVTIKRLYAPTPNLFGLGTTGIQVTVKNNSTTTNATVTVAVSQTGGIWSLPPILPQASPRLQTLPVPAGAEITFEGFPDFNPGTNGTVVATATVTAPTGWTGDVINTTTTNTAGFNVVRP